MSIAAILGMIESRARHASHYAKQTSEAVSMLQARRSFYTRAEDELARAENEILSALNIIKAARETVNALPASDKAA